MLSLCSRDEQLIGSGGWKMQPAGQGVNGCLEVSHPPLPPGWVAFPTPCHLCFPYPSAAFFVSLNSKGHLFQHLFTLRRARQPLACCFSLK